MIDVVWQLAAFVDLEPGVVQKLGETFESIGTHTSVQAGSEITHEGTRELAQGFLLLSGTAEVSKDGGIGLEVNAPSLLGEMQLFNKTRERTATITAATECALLTFSWTDFMKALHTELSESESAHIEDAIRREATARYADQASEDTE